MAFVPGFPASNQNMFINPFYEFDQKREGAAITLATPDGGKLADGWCFTSNVVNGAAASFARVSSSPSPPLAYPYVLRATLTTRISSMVHNTFLRLEQRLEKQAVVELNESQSTGSPLCLSGWVNSSVTGTYFLFVNGNDGTNNYWYFTPFTITAANTWQFVTTLIPAYTSGSAWINNSLASPAPVYSAVAGIVVCAGTDYQGTAGSWVSSAVGSGTDKFSTSSQTQFLDQVAGGPTTFSIGPMKLELGSTVTQVSRSPWDAERVRVQRFYEKSYDLGTAPGAVTNNGCVEWIAQGVTGLIPIAFKSPCADATRVTLSAYSPNSGLGGTATPKIYDVTGAADVVASFIETGQNGTTISFTSVAGRRYRAHWVKDAIL